MLGHVLEMSRTQLYTQPERRLTSAEAQHIRRLVRRRLMREPSAYILGHREFYGIDLFVNRDTMIPRPETELLVEKAIELVQRMSDGGRQVTVADIGTGCGAIAISLALALPQAKIYATDVSATALRVAGANCRRYALDSRVCLLRGDLLEPLFEPVDLIVANLPYVRTSELKDLSPEIRGFEPMLALAGGDDGLDKIRQTLEQMPSKLNTGAGFLLEIGQGQSQAVADLIGRIFPCASIGLIRDQGGIERLVRVVQPEPGRG
jgi:release factor glutamine methyltransferase